MTTAVVRRERRRGGRGGWRVPALTAVGLVVLAAVAIHSAMPSWYARWWYPLEHTEAITGESAASGVPADLIAAVIYRESRFSEGARSDQGAVGLMQVLPETAQWISTQPGAPAATPERIGEPGVNIAYGVWYLHYLVDKYGSEDLALAAYNGGETNLQTWIADSRAAGRRTLRLVDIPFVETRSFVSAVQETRRTYRGAWGGALS